MSKYKYEVEVPKCFVDVVEYIYRMPYDEVIDRMHSGQIDDEIWLIDTNIETTRQYINVDNYKIADVIIERQDYYDSFTFRFYVADHMQMWISISNLHSITVSAIVSWLLNQNGGNRYTYGGYLECLDVYNMKYPIGAKSRIRLTPYTAIPYLVEHKDVEALGALCKYAIDNEGITYLLEKLDEIGAIEEKAFVLNWNNAHNAYKDQKFEL